MRQSRSVLIVPLLALSFGHCAAMEVSRISCAGGGVLRLGGDIEAGDYLKFRSYFGGERRIVGLDLESTGGSLREGVLIAALTRQKRLATFVGKECDSAC